VIREVGYRTFYQYRYRLRLPNISKRLDFVSNNEAGRASGRAIWSGNLVGHTHKASMTATGKTLVPQSLIGY